jgi:hypothetical protein
MSYDNWRCTNLIEEQEALNAAKVASLAEEIRLNLNLSDYLKCIECDASFDTKCATAISEAFKTGANPAIVLHGYALDWLDNHAAELATQRLQGDQE